MSILWVVATAMEDEPHEKHALHPAFKAAGIKEAPCGFSRCPDQDFEHSKVFDKAENRLYDSIPPVEDARADWWPSEERKTNLPVEHLDLSKPLHGFESTADLHTLRRYTNHPEARTGIPIVFRHQGKHFIMNGHHGLSGALRRGDAHADVHMIDLDKED